MSSPNRRVGIVLAVVIALLAISIPVLAASPPPSADPGDSAKPENSAKPEKSAKPERSAKPEKPAKPDKVPEVAITLKGTVEKTTDAEGRPSFTMTVDGKTWSLSAGPPWFWGNNNPLAAFVGKSVTIVGTTRTGAADVDVESVDGKALRAAGKPPWAGGPWVVGPSHPGWKSWMAGGKPGNGHGRDNAPGQLKKATPTS